MGISDWSTLIMSMVAIIGSMATFVKIFFPSKKERAEAEKEHAAADKTDADAASAWEGIAARAAEREKALSARLDALGEEINQLKISMREKDALIRKHQRQIEVQLVGIKILTEQLCEVGAVPRWRPSDE